GSPASAPAKNPSEGRGKRDMKFGIFDYIDARGETLQKTYEDRLALLQAAEAAGFYGYHLTEHHATPLSMTPSPSVFLAAAARETRRIRPGTLLYLLPLYHPLRLLEELCMLDHLSGGRLDIGVGRGISPMEFDAYRVDFQQAGADYEHVLNILYQGFTQERIDYRCDRFTFKDVPGRNPAAAAPASAVVVRAARRSWSGVCGTARHARGDARSGREGREHAGDLPRALADLCGRPHAPAIAGGDAPLRRDARDLRRRFRRRGRAPRAAGLQALVRQSRLAVGRARLVSADLDLGRLRPVEGRGHFGGRKPRHGRAHPHRAGRAHPAELSRADAGLRLAHARPGNALAGAIQKRDHAEARGDELRRGFACSSARNHITHDALAPRCIDLKKETAWPPDRSISRRCWHPPCRRRRPSGPGFPNTISPAATTMPTTFRSIVSLRPRPRCSRAKARRLRPT